MFTMMNAAMLAIGFGLSGAAILIHTWLFYGRRSKLRKKPPIRETPDIGDILGGDKVSDSMAGASVQVDCRNCGKINRVVHRGMLMRPKCGSCKTKLLPKQMVKVCLVVEDDGDPVYSKELYDAWTDPERLWQVIYARTLRFAGVSTVQDHTKMN